jgi:opacity protein-like surface antigen
MLAGGALIALSSVAVAADLLPPAPALEPPPLAAEFSGWYLRGDVGLGVNASTPSLAVSPNPLAGYPASATNNFYNSSISASGIFDIGFGYQFNNWLRGDITEEYRGGGHFQSLEVLNDYAGGLQYSDFYRANMWSAVTMFNGYADMGTWWGVTPYVGAGVGFAYNKLFGVTDNGYEYNSADTAEPLQSTGGYFDDGGKWNFAWALMAGLSFNVTQNLKLDLGYRYLDYGKYTTGKAHCLDAGSQSGFGCSGGSYTIYSKNELASNDFRIGLRWMIGEEPTYAPPLVRKY